MFEKLEKRRVRREMEKKMKQLERPEVTQLPIPRPAAPFGDSNRFSFLSSLSFLDRIWTCNKNMGSGWGWEMPNLCGSEKGIWE